VGYGHLNKGKEGKLERRFQRDKHPLNERGGRIHYRRGKTEKSELLLPGTTSIERDDLKKNVDDYAACQAE